MILKLRKNKIRRIKGKIIIQSCKAVSDFIAEAALIRLLPAYLHPPQSRLLSLQLPNKSPLLHLIHPIQFPTVKLQDDSVQLGALTKRFYPWSLSVSLDLRFSI